MQSSIQPQAGLQVTRQANCQPRAVCLAYRGSVHHAPCYRPQPRQHAAQHSTRAEQVVRTAAAHPSVDPLVAAQDDGIYRPGKTLIIHNPAVELPPFINSPKLTVLMCKSSHCKPCKRFASTYYKLAERFSDCHLLEVTGDESPDTRKYMMELKVKVTPSFYFWRNGQQIHTMTGTGSGLLRNAILDRLLPDEAGRSWVGTEGQPDE